MSSHFKVPTLLSEADRSAFHALASNELTTIDALHGWLVERGYVVSRGAVANYRNHCRRGFLSKLRSQLDARSDAELRTKLAGWARQLSGGDLVSVAFLAAFMAEIATLRRGRKNGV
jgi:hypothetical protein